ncbi:MAG: hypothetical protein RI884_404 [Pseudomonadota bacterium]|jgi:hypothetical protein
MSMMNHIEASLPQDFSPRSAETLIRLGRNFDGGYLIDARNINESTALIGLGMNDDWSFESDFYSRKKIPVYVYDSTVSGQRFIKKFIKSIFVKFHRPKRLASLFSLCLSYFRFFREDRRHIRKLVGVDAPPGFVSLASILKDLPTPENRRIFLKVDIEGWEYRILEDLLTYSGQIEGLAIEFHDVDIHLDRIAHFIKKFPLKLIHVHGNNTGFVSKDGTPHVIECTFTSRTVGACIETDLPHPLDMPCNKDRPELKISFA